MVVCKGVAPITGAPLQMVGHTKVRLPVASWMMMNTNCVFAGGFTVMSKTLDMTFPRSVRMNVRGSPRSHVNVGVELNGILMGILELDQGENGTDWSRCLRRYCARICLKYARIELANVRPL